MVHTIAGGRKDCIPITCLIVRLIHFEKTHTIVEIATKQILRFDIMHTISKKSIANEYEKGEHHPLSRSKMVYNDTK